MQKIHYPLLLIMTTFSGVLGFATFFLSKISEIWNISTLCLATCQLYKLSRASASLSLGAGGEEKLS